MECLRIMGSNLVTVEYHQHTSLASLQNHNFNKLKIVFLHITAGNDTVNTCQVHVSTYKLTEPMLLTQNTWYVTTVWAKTSIVLHTNWNSFYCHTLNNYACLLSPLADVNWGVIPEYDHDCWNNTNEPDIAVTAGYMSCSGMPAHCGYLWIL